MKNIVLPIAIACLLAACSQQDNQQSVTERISAEDSARLCAAITTTEIAKNCVVNSRVNSINVIIDSMDDEAGREACAGFATKLMPFTKELSNKWRLQIFSPYRNDKTLATCPLH